MTPEANPSPTAGTPTLAEPGESGGSSVESLGLLGGYGGVRDSAP
jgi:hypothetical protein